MAPSNKAFEAVARDVSVFPRQVYDCSTAIHFKSVFIPVTFIGIIADMNPVKNYSVITLFLPAKVRYFLLVMHQIMMAFGLIVK